MQSSFGSEKSNWSVWRLDAPNLYHLAAFVRKPNYGQHKNEANQCNLHFGRKTQTDQSDVLQKTGFEEAFSKPVFWSNLYLMEKNVKIQCTKLGDLCR